MSEIEQVADSTCATIALAFRTGEVLPSRIVECLLERIQLSPSGNAFISVTADRARAEAREADARYKRNEPLSALDGVPIAWKDVIDVAGARTTGGSRLLAEQPSKAADLQCVANAAAAGMVCLGKLNLSELAYSGLGLNPHFGTPLNVRANDMPRAPGGSSSGCGVAIAAGLAPCAIGTDTGGSIRIPAAFNGVVGFKPSCGRVDKRGLLALAPTFDTIGPLARSVEDCALLDLVLRGTFRSVARPARLAGLSLLVPTNVVMDDLEPSVAANFERSIEQLAGQGVVIKHERIEPFDLAIQMTARLGSITAAEAYIGHRQIVESANAALLDRRVLSRILDGRNISASTLMLIQRERRALAARTADQLGEAILAFPTTPIVAPALAPLEADDTVFHQINLLTLRNTMLGNLLDHCGIALPNGVDREGLPTSILLSAPDGNDDRLLSAALAIERVLAGGAEYAEF